MREERDREREGRKGREKVKNWLIEHLLLLKGKPSKDIKTIKYKYIVQENFELREKNLEFWIKRKKCITCRSTRVLNSSATFWNMN